MNNKFKNTRVVTFDEDYKVKTADGKGKVLHKKGDTIHVHKSTAETLSKNGKVKVKEFDYEGEVAKAKKAAKKE